MAHDVVALLGPWGVARSADLGRVVDRHTIGRWVASGRLLRPHPGVLVLPARADAWHTRALAAAVGARGVLSHVSALTVLRLAPETWPVHVSIPAGRRAGPAPGVVVHRVRRWVPDRVGPFPVTDLDRALVDTWGWAHGAAGGRRSVEVARAAVITSLRERRLPADQLRAECARHPALPARAAFVELVDLVDGGCQSELEIWGVRRVLDGPGIPAFVQQHPVRLRSGTVHLDAAVPHLKVDVELDGAAFHGSAEDRERDTRRDVALAALGWVVLRFSYARLMSDPDGCRREIAAVCRAREALLRR
jgi:very-short-patch-repair endonuclease